jgi:hypothetical protein
MSKIESRGGKTCFADGPAIAARSRIGLTLGAHQERSNSQNQGADQVLKWNFTKRRRFANL